MHREISHADEQFGQESNLSLYLLTGLLGAIVGIDLWPAFASWAGDNGLSLPSWPREIQGYRIAMIAAILGGARVLYTSIEALMEGRVGADLALAIACIAAILFKKPLVAAEVVLVGMVGECLEGFTFARTQHAIRRLVEVFPRRCWLLRDGQEVRVLTSELQVGNRVVVKPGGRVPADGVVLEGRSALDVSALTGESLPIDVGPGDETLAGSLNQFGALTVEAKRLAVHTVVGRVIELTARALKEKGNNERTADRLARYFLPVVLGLAAVTFIIGVLLNLGGPEANRRGFFEAARASIDPTLAVLVVACPCALILATPAAIIAALGRLAGTGILIKSGAALERLAEASAFAFDKTGTLTEGKLELGEIACLNGITSDELLLTAATAEQRSEHPLARLIIQEAASRKLSLDTVQDFQAHPGAGVVVLTVGAGGATAKCVVGTRRLLEEQGFSLTAEVLALLDRLDTSGQTPLLIARDGAVLGAIGARDRVRPEASGVLGELRTLGIHEIALLTGDRKVVAQTIAAQLDIVEVHAELLPTDKAAFVESWQGNGAGQTPRKVAMIGDGVNDAPALARADVGLAIGGTGADIAAEAGDIVFMGDPLRSLPLLVRLSRETVRIIRQNILIFAFGVNGVGIVLTAWLWPLITPRGWHEEAPLAAVVYHQFGSLAVLMNSMRLLWFERGAASPSWQRLKRCYQAMDDWFTHRLDLGEFFHWLSHHWKVVCASAAFLLVLLFALSGLVQVGPDEIAVVRRFGKPLVEDLGPGLHWRWPWPIEEIVRVRPERVYTVEVGFRSQPGLTDSSASQAWDAAHRDAIRLVPEEAVMITGDGNLVEIQAVVRFTISRPHDYLFAVRNPEDILRAAAESVLREAVAGRPFIELLTVDRGRFQQDVLERLERRCQAYGKSGLGIALVGLSLPDVHPPQEVVQAYHDVARAMEERARLENEARSQAIEKERQSRADAYKIDQDAEAEKNKKVRLAWADKEYFLVRRHARSQLSYEQEWQLFRDSYVEILHGRDKRDVYPRYQQRRQDLMARQAVLTDFRMFWDSLSKVLAGREKIIIDADRVPGKRNLLLFDPDKLRVPVPVIMPDSEIPQKVSPRERE